MTAVSTENYVVSNFHCVQTLSFIAAFVSFSLRTKKSFPLTTNFPMERGVHPVTQLSAGKSGYVRELMHGF